MKIISWRHQEACVPGAAATPSRGGGASPLEGKNPRKLLAGVQAHRCRHPIAVNGYRRVALPTFDRPVGGPRIEVRQDDPPPHRAGHFRPINDKSISMAVYSQRKPLISAAPGRNVPGALPVAFPSTGGIPRGPRSLRRNGRARHRSLAPECLLVRKPTYLLTVHNSDKRPFGRVGIGCSVIAVRRMPMMPSSSRVKPEKPVYAPDSPCSEIVRRRTERITGP